MFICAVCIVCLLFPKSIGIICMCLCCWLEGLSPIGVWDVLDGGTHDGHGTV